MRAVPMMHRDYCMPEFLHSLLSEKQELMLLDFRGVEDFDGNHIDGAINLQIGLYQR